MDPIKSFTITDLTVSGFKCYGGKTHWKLGNPTVITGGNGRGKSSLADAIAFAVTGLPFFGERGIDKLHAEENPELFISMGFVDDKGAAHLLTRSRLQNRMTITMDGRELRQADLTELFGEKDVFLSILNPLYFIEELGDDGKKLLERYLPEISQDTVLAELPLPVRESLCKEQILSPESCLKKKRSEIRELENSTIYLTGQKDLADSQRKKAAAQREYLLEHKKKLQAEYDQWDARRCAGFDPDATQAQLVSLSEQYEQMAKEVLPAVDTAKLESQIAEAREALARRQAEPYAPKYAQVAAETSAKVKDLAARYRREHAALTQMQAEHACPTCKRTLSDQELPAVCRDLTERVEKIVTSGKEAKAQLDELLALEKKTEDTFLQFKAQDVQKLTEEIGRLIQKRETLASRSASARETELDDMIKKIRELTTLSECGMLTRSEYERYIKCGKEIEECDAAIRLLSQEIDAPAEDYDAQIRSNDAAITALKQQIADLALYIGKRAELLFSSLKMNRVEISLYDVVKTTGEVKDTFCFTYNGRRYDRLSLSEKIRAGMEVSELMKRLTGRNYPQFIDNMESVDDLANVKPTGQIIMAKCVHGAPLSVQATVQAPDTAKAA